MKEDLKIHSVNGEVYEFNVFSATLGYSRKHIFILLEKQKMILFDACLKHLEDWVV